MGFKVDANLDLSDLFVCNLKSSQQWLVRDGLSTGCQSLIFEASGGKADLIQKIRNGLFTCSDPSDITALTHFSCYQPSFGFHSDPRHLLI